ncbi:MAG: Hsp33 family molecular chaperone HslO [Planctomycetota bacterium]
MSTEVPIYSYLYRERDVVVLFGDLTRILEDFSLHVLSVGLEYDGLTHQLLSDGLQALSFHLATRPADEYVGWTICVEDPRAYLFFTGSSRSGAVVGRAFDDEVEAKQENIFVSQVKRDDGETRTSSVPVEGVDLFGMVEGYYRTSEQKLARFFHRDSVVAFAQALPNADNEWLRKVGTDEIFDLHESGKLDYLATREFRFRCGCHKDRIAGLMVGAYGTKTDDLFQSDPSVEVQCPRCGANTVITREDYERLLKKRV